ncbi:MAG: FAD-dependent monooxygenase [Verrucomicrobiota bacterium]
MSASSFDLIINGAGPAGSACAIAAARRGCRVALVERVNFPRHKVCGDCLNPSVWPVLAALGVEREIRALPHTMLDRVRFVSRRGRSLELPLPPGAEWGMTRQDFDAALLAAAGREGAVLYPGSPVTGVSETENGWRVETDQISLTARTLVAADGRNSTTCRLLQTLPPAKPGRLALQCHIPLVETYRHTVALEWTEHGYCGLAHVGADLLNLCVVATGGKVTAAKAEARRRYQLPENQVWHSIAPLDRAALLPAPAAGLFLAGDTARVVEPFTGEGIFYALRSGALAAEAALRHLAGQESAAFYTANHRALYHNRLWVNRFARFTVTRPWAGEAALALSRLHPGGLRWLTSKVVPGNAGAFPLR